MDSIWKCILWKQLKFYVRNQLKIKNDLRNNCILKLCSKFEEKAINTVWQLYNATDFILTKVEVPTMMQCMPSMRPYFICNLATTATPHAEHDGKYGAMLCR
jgi:hypothetical protein